MFKDHFSHDPVAYSRHRPGYPDSLYECLASLCSNHELAWDCATGSGQAAQALTKHFKRVVATDASAAQISQAIPNSAIQYLVTAAEDCCIAPDSIDLITVAQAIHWFDLRRFTREVERTLKPGGVLAVWSYNLLTVRSDIDALVNHLYGPVLKQYWPQERAIVEGGYKELSFPFTSLEIPQFYMTQQWTLQQFTDYLSTWSAVNTYRRLNGTNPLDIIYPQLSEQWGEPESTMSVQWPLTVKAWKKTISTAKAKEITSVTRYING